MAITYEPIATTTLSSSAATVSFTSISGSYTDIICIVTGKLTTAETLKIQFNSNTGSNYSMTRLYNSGASVLSERGTSETTLRYGVWRTTNPQYAIIQIQNYSNSTTYKSCLVREYDDSGIVSSRVGLWRNTNAITRIDFTAGTASYATGCIFTIYGIKAA